MIKIQLYQRNMTETIEPLNYSNCKRYDNYMAIVYGLDSEGKEVRTYLREIGDPDMYFNTKDVKAGDILIACCWDNYKRRSHKCYYIVQEINNDEMTIDDGHTTYLKTVKSLKELSNE